MGKRTMAIAELSQKSSETHQLNLVLQTVEFLFDNTLLRLKHEIERMREDIARSARALIRNLERSVQSLEQEQRLENELGDLQGSGMSHERLIGELNGMQAFYRIMVGTFREAYARDESRSHKELRALAYARTRRKT